MFIEHVKTSTNGKTAKKIDLNFVENLTGQ